MKKTLLSITLLLMALLPAVVHATPSQFGASGLITVPTADTLDSGNLAIGLWLNSSDTGTENTTLVPISLTLGLGSFIEMYGSFPNLLFNDEEAASGRGYADLGLKTRILGRRSSPVKFSIDLQAQRHIDTNQARDGLTDFQGRGILSFKTSRFGLHLNGGYLKSDTKSGLDDQVVGGAGLEFYPMARLRILSEFTMATKALSNQDQAREALFGFQYFISPHLTFHASYGIGLTDAVNDWRVITGFSTSMGIGTYTKPIPRIIAEPETKVKKEPIKKARFKALTPLMPKTKKLATEPVEKLEVPIDPSGEKVLLYPSQHLKAKVPEGTPVSSPAPIAQPMVKEIPVKQISETPIAAVVYRKFRLDELGYEFDQHTLSAAGILAIALVAEKLRKEHKSFLLRIDGHTDTTGSRQYNEQLSYKRAVSVAKAFIANEGVDPATIFIKGTGESEEIADNSTPEGRALNRRSDILVLLPEKK